MPRGAKCLNPGLPLFLPLLHAASLYLGPTLCARERAIEELAKNLINDKLMCFISNELYYRIY